MQTAPLDVCTVAAGLSLVTGANGSGKSTAARALAASVAGAELLSAESQQAFYEAELAKDESNFRGGVDTSSKVSTLLGDSARAHPLFEAFRLAPLWDRGYRLLSTGEGRKVLLLRAVLRAPSLLVLDEPFDGLDVNACAELARGILVSAERVPVVVVGGFRPSAVPFPAESIREVHVVEAGRVQFRGTFSAWASRPGRAHARRAPPVELAGPHEPLATSTELVVLKQGRVQYGEQVVFENLNLRIASGQHTLIEGPNGSGKSTLLEMLTGDHPQAYANDLTLFGRRRGTGETVWDIKKNVGLVSPRLHRDYRVSASVEEVLLSGLFDSIGLYTQPDPRQRDTARAWLDWLGLDVQPKDAFRALSFGQQRMVLVGRAAIKVPPLVVMDEPTSGLDDDNRRHVLELIESLCTQHLTTVLMVTHRDDERVFWRERIHGAHLSLGAPPPVEC